MTIPADYNAVSMRVTPSELSTAADAIKSLVGLVANELTSIGDTLTNLELGWDGSTAAEAKSFSSQWMAAMTELFGPPDGSSGHSGQASYPGVLNAVVTGLEAAAGNYSAAESAIESMFGALSSQLGAAGQGSGQDPIPAGTSITDGSLSAVGEINWTAI